MPEAQILVLRVEASSDFYILWIRLEISLVIPPHCSLHIDDSTLFLSLSSDAVSV